MLLNNYFKSGILSIDNYNIDLSNAKVGEKQDQVVINCRHTEQGIVVGTNTKTSDTQNNGAGFTFVTSYDFRG